MQVLPAGPDALLVDSPDAADVPLLYADLRRDVPCRDVVPEPAPCSWTVCATPKRLMRTSPPGGRRGRPQDRDGRLVELPTSYDGPDLDDVARRWDMTRAEAVATHTGTELRVAFVGFAPGFAYCTGLPARAPSVPRLDRPRAKVSAGSVGLAGGNIPGSTRRPRRAAGGWSAAPTRGSGTPTATSRPC